MQLEFAKKPQCSIASLAGGEGEAVGPVCASRWAFGVFVWVLACLNGRILFGMMKSRQFRLTAPKGRSSKRLVGKGVYREGNHRPHA
jgi:hypothetical protein